MLTLYKSLVISILDYCSPLWHPSGSAYLSNKIEGVQRSFTRRLSGMPGLNYWERLKFLRLYSLQRRRERYLILYVFKILHNLVPNCGLSFTTNARTGIHVEVPLTSRSYPASLRKAKEASFNIIAPKLFNLLPSTMRVIYPNRGALDCFKRHLDHLLQNVPDQPTINGLQRLTKSNSLLYQMNSNFV